MDESLFEIFKSELSDLGDANCDWLSEISVKNEEAKEKSVYGSPVFKTPLLSSRAKRERNFSCSASQKRLKSAELAESEPKSDAIIRPQLDWASPVSSKPATGVSSNQGSGKVPSSLHTLLDDRSNVSWSSVFATPVASNVTWSNLNSEEKKVLMPSNSVTTPTVFSPEIDQELVDHCRLLDCTFDIAGISSQDPSVLEKSTEIKAAKDKPQRLAVLDNDERDLQSLKEQSENKSASQMLQVSDTFCSPLKSEKSDDFRESETPDSGVADGACSSRTNRTVDPVLNSTSTAVIRNLFKNFNHLSKTDPKCQISANDSGATGFSHIKLSGDTVCKKVQESNTTCSELNTANTPNSQDFLHDLSINTLNELCQTTEMIPPALCSPDDHLNRQSMYSAKKVAVRRTSTPIVQPQNTKWQRRLKFQPTEHEDWAEEGDSIMEQAAQELQSPEKDRTVPDAGSRVQEIKKNASVLRRFVYSVNDIKPQENNTSCKVQMEDLIKSAEILELAFMADSNKKHRNLANVKTMANETQEFISFSKLNSSFNAAETSSALMDPTNNTLNRSYKNVRSNSSSTSAVWNDTVGNENEAVDSVHAVNICSTHLTKKPIAAGNKRKRKNETALANNLEGKSYFRTSLPKENYLSEYKTINGMENEQNQLCANTSPSNDTVSLYAEKKITCNKRMPGNLNSSSWNNEHCSSESLNGHNSNSGFMLDLQMIKAVEHAETMHTLKASASNNNYLSERTSLPSNKMSAIQNTAHTHHKSAETNTSDSSGDVTKGCSVAKDNSQMDAFALSSTIVQQLFDDSPEDFKAYTLKNNYINPDVTSSSLHHSLAATYQLNPNIFCEELHETKELLDKIVPEMVSTLTDRSESAISDTGEKIVKSEKNAATVEEYDATSDWQPVSEERTSPILQGSSSVTKRLRNKNLLTKNFELVISKKETSFKKPKFSSFKQSKENVKEPLDDFEESQSETNKLQLYASSETKIVKTAGLSLSNNKGLLQQQRSSAACREKPCYALNKSVGVGNESVPRKIGAFIYKSSTKFEPCNSTVGSTIVPSTMPSYCSRRSLAECNFEIDEKPGYQMCEIPMQMLPSFQSFATASDERVKISDKAVQKVKKLFVKIDKEDTNGCCELEPNDTPIMKSSHFESSVCNEMLNVIEKVFPEDNKEDASESFEPEQIEAGSMKIPNLLLQGKKIKVLREAPNEEGKLFVEDVDERCEFELSETASREVHFQDFATASGKKVKVSGESILKARELLAEIDKEEDADSFECKPNEASTKVPQFQGFTSGETFNVRKPFPEANEEVSNGNCKLRPNETSLMKLPQTQGFATASGRKINVSSKALQQARKLIAEVDKEMVDDKLEPSESSTERIHLRGFTRARGKKVSISNETLSRAKKLFAEDIKEVTHESYGPELNESPSTVVPQFQGIATASGKKVIVSSKALLKAKKLFAEEDANEHCGFEVNKTRSIKVPQFQGFATASGKKVSVSIEALLKAKKLFAEEDANKQCEVEGNNETPTKVPQFQGFATASGKKVNVSIKTLLKAKKLFNEENTDEHCGFQVNETPSTKVSHFQGFATASGKKVNVSSEALLKAKKLFAEEDAKEDCGLEENETPSTKVSHFQGFATASGKKVNVSSEALLKAKKLFAEEDAKEDCGLEENETPSTKVSHFQGFATASGKKVNVSSEAFLKAKKLVAEEDDNEHCGLEGNNETPSTKVSHFQGFATASGKKVNVSSEALLKAKKLFAEEDAKEDCGLEENETPSTKVSRFQGFATASGKKVNVSIKALLKAKKLFDEENTDEHCGLEVNETPSTKVSHFQGFATASEKKVNVSSEALLKAKKLFAEEDAKEDCGLEENETPSTKVSHFQGFATASGKKVNVSIKALLKAKKLFDEENTDEHCGLEVNETPSTKVSHFQGFATASGKKVNVSSEALLKAKKLFAEEDANEHCGLEVNETPSTTVGQFQGFATASGKKVSVSNEALHKARKLFVEVDKEDATESIQLELNKTPSIEAPHLQDFATASGKKVSVSNEALFKAKKLFIEENEESSSKSYEFNSNEILLTKVNVQCFPTANDKVKIAEGSVHKVNTFLEEFNNEKVDKCELEPSKAINKSLYSSINQYFEDTEDNISGEYLKVEATAALDIGDSRICAPKATIEKELNDLVENTCRCILEEHMCGDCRKKSSASNIINESNSEGKNVKIIANFHSAALKGTQKHVNSGKSSENSCGFVNETTKSMKTKSVQTKASEYNWTLSQEVKESAAALLADDNWWSEGYISCPDMVNDRDVAPSAIFSDNNSSSPPVPQPGSPILGRIKTQRSKSFGPSQNCESPSPAGLKFKVPYKTSGSARSVSEKTSKRMGMNLDFGTPFAKRLKIVENMEDRKCDSKQSVGDISRDVCAGRLAAAEEQECLIKKRLKFGASGSRPCTGSLYARKREQRLLRWRDVANGRPPEKYTISELLELGVKTGVLSVTAENALEYRFCASDYYSESLCLRNVKGIDMGDGAQLVLAIDGTAGLKEVTRAFLASPGIEPSLVPAGWVSNHYRWLIWKLAATERRFPLQFAGRCLNPNMLMLQLKYRYDREIDHSHRPALRKILEHDDSPAKRLVLCVARITNLQIKEGEPNHELELTDGWYGIMSCIDRDMCRFINKGIICVGTKLITYGAELVNCEQACSPLEVGSNVRLKLYSNSTRRACWDTKLGFYSQPGPLSISLTSILPMGGPVGSVKVVVARRYPLVYIEKADEGKSVVRSSKLEERVAAEWERKRQECAEALFSQVRAEFQQCNRKSSGPSCIRDISKLSSGDELCRLIESCSDPGAFEKMLSEEQKQVITSYQMEQQQQMQQELEGRMLQKLEDSSSASRTVIPVFKVRCMEPKLPASQSAMLSIWRPSEEVMHLLKEGASVNLFNITAAGQRGGHLQLSAGRYTRYQALPKNEKIVPERIVVSLDRAAAADFHPSFGEVDIVGIVIHIGAAPQRNSGFQIVYLSDVDMNILGVAFWGGVKQYGWEDLLVPRVVVAGCNLNKRHGAAVRWVPCVYASEYSSFSSHPRMSHLLHAFTSLQQSLLQQDLKKFYSACEEKVTSLLQGVVLASSRNRLPSAPLATNSSPSVCNTEVLQKTPESSAVQQRIRKLEQYGEPPPLSPLIALPVPPSLRKEFHVPNRKASSSKTDVDDSPPLSLESDPG